MSMKPRHTGRFGTPQQSVQPAEQAPEPIVNGVEDPSQEPGVAPENAGEPNAAAPVEPSVPNEIDEAKFLEFFKNKTGREVNSFEDLAKPVVEEKPTYDDETRRFLKYQETQGGSMKDWLELNKDWDKTGEIDLLRLKTKEEYGTSLSDADIDSLIKDKYGLDEFDDFSEIEGLALAKIKADANKYRSDKKTSQQEILKSLDSDAPVGKDSQPNSEMITLSSGIQVDKELYLKQRREYEEERAAALESLNEASFSFKITTEDGEKEMPLKYLYTNEDKQKMLSKSEDTGRLLQEFIDENKKLKHGEFNEGLLWADKKHRETVLIPRLLAQAFSMGIDNQIAEERNIHFGTQRPVAQPRVGSQIDKSKLPGRPTFGPRFSLNKKTN